MECQGALASVHRNQPAIEASLKVVNVVGILDQAHGSSYVMVNGRKEKRCSIFPTMTCEEHFKIADYAFLNGFASSDGQKQVLICVFNSQGKRPGKWIHNPGGEGYVKMVEDAVKKIDAQTISKPVYDAFMAQMDAAKQLQDKHELRKAIDILLKASQHEIKRLGGIADERVREINEEGSGRVTEAEGQATKDLAKAKEALKQVIRDYAPLDCSKRAEEVLKRLSGKK